MTMLFTQQTEKQQDSKSIYVIPECGGEAKFDFDRSQKLASLAAASRNARLRMKIENRITLVLITIAFVFVVFALWLLFAIKFDKQSSTCVDVQASQRPRYSIRPERIHLSLGDDANHLIVTWYTANRTSESIVDYGIHSLDHTIYGIQKRLSPRSNYQAGRFMHRAYLSRLQPNTTYQYRVGSKYVKSETFRFRNFPQSSRWSPRLAIFGDLDHRDLSVTLRRLHNETMNGILDLLIHIGDSIELNVTRRSWKSISDRKTTTTTTTKMPRSVEDPWSKFEIAPIPDIKPMDDLWQSFAAFAPLQALPDISFDDNFFSDFEKNFSSFNFGEVDDGSSSSKGHNNNKQTRYWSYDIGPAHIVSFSTDCYFQSPLDIDRILDQYKWLETDLRRANLAENRIQRPWIITAANHAMYDHHHDNNQMSALKNKFLRVGNASFPGLEQLFYQNGVDLAFWNGGDGERGHGGYERSWPLFDNIVYNGSVERPYTNARAPVHISTGAAMRQSPSPPYIAFTDDVTGGFSLLNILNSTHLNIRQIIDPIESMNDKIIDEFFLIKDHAFDWW